jgi:hypothetical protein
MCGELLKMIVRYYTISHPEKKKELELLRCEIQPYRNAGDSPECWYFNGDANSTGTSQASYSPEYITPTQKNHHIIFAVRGRFSNTLPLMFN